MAKKPVVKPSEQEQSHVTVRGKMIGVTPLSAGTGRKGVLLMMQIDGRETGLSLLVRDAVALVERVAEVLAGTTVKPALAAKRHETLPEARSHRATRSVITKFVRFVQTAASEWTSIAAVPMITIWLKGLPRPIGLTQRDATSLVASLVRSLASQKQPLAQRMARALPRWADDCERHAQLVRQISAAAEMGKPTKGLVSRQSIDQTHGEIRKAGAGLSFTLLVREVEPDLAAFIEAHIDALDSRPASLEGRRLALLAIVTSTIASLRKAHYQLWADTAVGTRLVQLDPTLADTDRPSNEPH